LRNIHFLTYQPLETLSDAMAAADLHLVSLRPALEGQIVPSKFYGIAAAERPVVFIGDPDGELAQLISESDCGFVVAGRPAGGRYPVTGRRSGEMPCVGPARPKSAGSAIFTG
jgi:hypothetical protein